MRKSPVPWLLYVQIPVWRRVLTLFITLEKRT
jgi:hypothetical protein